MAAVPAETNGEGAAVSPDDKPARTRGRSQSSAAVLSPPHSPPQSSLALDPFSSTSSNPVRLPDPSSSSPTAPTTRIAFGRSASVFTPTARPFEPSSVPNQHGRDVAAENAQRWWGSGAEPSPSLGPGALPHPSSPASVPGAFGGTSGAAVGSGRSPRLGFPTGWTGGGEDDLREGRPLMRHHQNGGLGHGAVGSGQRDLSVGSIGSSVHSGIGISNRSPFAGTSMLPPTGGFGFPSSAIGIVPSSTTAAGAASGGRGVGSADALARGRPRESTLGAVGTRAAPIRYGSMGAQGGLGGREGWSGGRSLTNDLDEDDEFAATRSGATSRRHSVAAFTGRSIIGFDVPSSSLKPADVHGGSHNNNGATMFSSGNSALTDDDLIAGDLNSLQINLEAHAAEQQRRESAPSSAPRAHHPTQGPRGSSHSPAGRATNPLPPISAALPTRQTRAPSFSAGDPYSASAQVSRFFVQQQQQQQQSQPSPSSPKGHSPGTVQDPAQPQQTSRFAFGQATTAQPGQQPFGMPRPAGLNVGPAPFFPSHHPAPLAAPGPPGLGGPLGVGPPGMGAGPDLSELGKGVPLHQVPPSCPLYIVEFNHNRTDLFYASDPILAASIHNGDYVIVEADRGKDLGKVVHNKISTEDVQAFQQRQVEIALGQLAAAPQAGAQPPNPAALARLTKEMHPKRIYAKATHADAQLLLTKAQDEAKALALCRSKALQRGLAMEITGAEWQWDRRKLTFFFIADKRVDFRELVRELFRVWKTRIWMCSVNP